MDPEEKRKQLERDILLIMEKKLSSGDMDEERARSIARMLLDKLHPPLSLEQIYQIAPSLDDHFAELREAVLPLMTEHDEKLRTAVTQQAEKLIRQGNIAGADKILKEALQGETTS